MLLLLLKLLIIGFGLFVLGKFSIIIIGLWFDEW